VQIHLVAHADRTYVDVFDPALWVRASPESWRFFGVHEYSWEEFGNSAPRGLFDVLSVSGVLTQHTKEDLSAVGLRGIR
jgi:hypothetical protein